MHALKTTLRNIRRTPYQTVASLLVMVLTFFLSLLFLVASFGSNRVLRYFESSPKVSAYFTDKATEDDAKAVRSKLEATGKIASIRFISKDEALKIYSESFRDKPHLTEFVQKDFLPMSLDIKTNKPEEAEEIANVLKSFDTVEEVVFPKDLVKELLTWTRGIRLFGLAITIYAMVTSVFTILIVIGMKIANKRDEIEILQLVGATPWYVRAPFLLEGILYGVIGAVTAWAIGVGPFLHYVGPITKFFGAETAVFPPTAIFLLTLLGIQVVIGILIGCIGSFIALLRYLRN